MVDSSSGEESLDRGGTGGVGASGRRRGPKGTGGSRHVASVRDRDADR